MLLLANENFPEAAVLALRARGHDVAWVCADAPGSNDRQVLARAVAEGRLLVTFDKDFGELAFRAGLPASCGIVLFRIPMSSPTKVAQTAVTVLESRTDWAGQFSVVEEHRVRMTRLPPSPNGSNWPGCSGEGRSWRPTRRASRSTSPSGSTTAPSGRRKARGGCRG